MLITQFLRCTTPLDPKISQAMGHPRNQKERVRYSFNIKRIYAAARDTDALKKDFGSTLEALGIEPIFPKQSEQSEQLPA